MIKSAAGNFWKVLLESYSKCKFKAKDHAGINYGCQHCKTTMVRRGKYRFLRPDPTLWTWRFRFHWWNFWLIIWLIFFSLLNFAIIFKIANLKDNVNARNKKQTIKGATSKLKYVNLNYIRYFWSTWTFIDNGIRDEFHKIKFCVSCQYHPKKFAGSQRNDEQISL